MGIREFINKITKRDDLVVDLSDLQKRGIYKPGKEMPIESGSEIVDLTPPTPSGSSSDGSSALGFLGALSSSSSSSDSETETISATTVSYSEKKQKLKGILRDMKGKIDSTYNKIYKLTERLDLLEKKVERLERRSGV